MFNRNVLKVRQNIKERDARRERELAKSKAAEKGELGEGNLREEMMLFLLSEAIKKERENTLKKGCPEKPQKLYHVALNKTVMVASCRGSIPPFSHTQTHTVLIIHRVLTSKKNSDENKILEGGRNGLRKC